MCQVHCLAAALHSRAFEAATAALQQLLHAAVLQSPQTFLQHSARCYVQPAATHPACCCCCTLAAAGVPAAAQDSLPQRQAAADTAPYMVECLILPVVQSAVVVPHYCRWL
jgi:hypothetical protein